MRDGIGVKLLLVTKGHWFKRKNRFARFVHRLNLVLESGRRLDRAKLTVGSYHHCYTWWDGCPTDALYVGGLLNSSLANANSVRLDRQAGRADVNVVVASLEIGAGIGAQSRVIGPGAIRERSEALGRVVIALKEDSRERLKTVSRVVGAITMGKRLNPIGRIFASGKVFEERPNTGARVVAPCVVASERENTGGRVVIAVLSSSAATPVAVL